MVNEKNRFQTVVTWLLTYVKRQSKNVTGELIQKRFRLYVLIILLKSRFSKIRKSRLFIFIVPLFEGFPLWKVFLELLKQMERAAKRLVLTFLCLVKSRSDFFQKERQDKEKEFMTRKKQSLKTTLGRAAH